MVFEHMEKSIKLNTTTKQNTSQKPVVCVQKNAQRLREIVFCFSFCFWFTWNVNLARQKRSVVHLSLNENVTKFYATNKYSFRCNITNRNGIHL